jgi:hypothetical protein
VKPVALALRFLLELAALGALAYCGAHAAPVGAFGRITLAVAAPLAAALVWGAFVSPERAPVRVWRQYRSVDGGGRPDTCAPRERAAVGNRFRT